MAEKELAYVEDIDAAISQVQGLIAQAKAEAIAAAGTGRGILLRPNERYGPDTPSTTTQALLANRMYFARIQIAVAGFIDEVRIAVTTPAANSVIRLGMYNYTTGDLVAEWGTVDAAAAANDRSLVIAEPTEVEAGTYLLCAVAEGGGPTVTAIGGAGIGPQSGAATSLSSGLHRAANTTTGSLPTSITVASLTGAGFRAPRILIRGA